MTATTHTDETTVTVRVARISNRNRFAKVVKHLKDNAGRFDAATKTWSIPVKGDGSVLPFKVAELVRDGEIEIVEG